MSRIGNALRRVHGGITKRPTNFSWVSDGALAGSGMPTTRAEFDWVVSQGVRVIVTMTEDALPREWTGALDGYLHVPTIDFTAPALDDIERAVAFMRDHIKAGRPAMVHCAAGRGRAGTILACYLIRYEGLGAAEAIARIRSERPGSIQSEPQEAAIAYYADHVGATRE